MSQFLSLLIIITLAQFAKSDIPDTPPSAESRIPIYSYYSWSFKDHYLTSDYSEFTVGNEIYAYDGIAFYLREHQDIDKNSVPLFLYYHGYPVYDHYYTTSPDIIPNSNQKPKILGYCYPENKKQDGMVPLHKYFHSNKNDHLYEVTSADILVDLEIGDIREEDEYQYQGVECYVFQESLENKDEINDYETGHLPKNFKELPPELGGILKGGKDKEEVEEEEEVEVEDQRPQRPQKPQKPQRKDGRDIKYLLISSDGVSEKHGIYTFVIMIIMIGVISTMGYFYCYSKRHVDIIYEQEESEPLLTTMI